ncbi:type II secretion system F family protein [Celeribacter indicus]|uniref:Type II/IV secretion system protein TadB, Flp pilus assembly protein TadB n=1 Tax=Celeribacter indicus TaxID=1208324 RepID=A0A0B5E0P4_9RHOB|nr:type II secretion system F family protein [Celeribacter indicus]AJE48839.1 type II/IV secretion system protein TadB, Flp pilus assembly protein TadB [Celeribacter indicus]SDW38794.1 tight adherence protein B [Celeribacter indicus]
MTAAQAVVFLSIFVLCMACGFAALMILDRSRRVRRARLARAGMNRAAAHQNMRKLLWDQGSVVKPVAGDRRRSGLPGLLDERLAKAGLGLSPRALALLVLMANLGFVLVAAFAFGVNALLAIPLGIALSWLLVSGALSVLQARRIRSVIDSLPECLDVFARGLRAGKPIPEALDLVAQNAGGVAQAEFRTCCDEMRLGVTLPGALGGLASRIDTPEVRYIAVATSLQAETGGNLVETLDNLASLLRERHKLRKKAAALTAETRMSAAILSALPFVVGAVIYVMNPTYLAPLAQDPRGRVLALAGMASIAGGIFTMYRMARIDV